MRICGWKLLLPAPLTLWLVGAVVADGRIRYREDITDGLENAPAAFIGMLEAAISERH
jgi:hypothetical protein